MNMEEPFIWSDLLVKQFAYDFLPFEGAELHAGESKLEAFKKLVSNNKFNWEEGYAKLRGMTDILNKHHEKTLMDEHIGNQLHYKKTPVNNDDIIKETCYRLYEWIDGDFYAGFPEIVKEFYNKVIDDAIAAVKSNKTIWYGHLEQIENQLQSLKK